LNFRTTALLLALVVATAVLAVVPRSPIARLANYDSDGPDPLYDADVDGKAIRRAGELIPEDATYYIHTAPTDPLLIGNLKAAGQLFFAPALPVRDVARAEWIVSYQAPKLVPAGLHIGRAYRLGERIWLLEVES
jgi:hypothetical protein